MKTMHLQYDGVDWVARLVRFLVDLVQDDLAFHNNNNNNNTTTTAAASANNNTTTTTTSVTDWAELLAVRPRTYLRLSLAMDLSMSSGRFPDKKDFLARLDGTRLGRSAKALRSLPEPLGTCSAPLRAPRNAASRRGGGPAPLPQQPAAGAGGDAAVPALDRGGADDYGMPEDTAMGDASSYMVDALGGGPCQPHQEGFAADADLDRFTSLADELDDFFDPALGDLASSQESSTSKSFDVDVDNALLAAHQETIQL